MRIKFTIAIVCCLFIAVSSASAQVKILFDATKAETAGNADWVIDADLFNLNFNTGPATIGGGNEANPQRFPTPLQSTVTATTTENYWKGGISSWGIDCVKKGYEVETLPYNGVISYGNSSNAQDLSNYKIFVVVEPNIVFSTVEKTAIINFVQNGGSLFMVSDHTVSDRNNDGWDSPAIWNDLFTNNGIKSNPFGIAFDLTNISGASTNISTYANDSLLHGSYGNVTQVLWSNGATITINTTANPTVKAAVYKSGASNTGSTNVLAAYARYGLGKVVAISDSSPFDDGTGDTNDQLYDGYITDANGNHQKLIMNATVWLATQNPLPVELSAFNVVQKNNTVQLQFTTATEINTNYFEIQQSTNGKDFTTIGILAAKGASHYFFNDVIKKESVISTIYYRLKIVDKNGSFMFSDVKSITLKLELIQDLFYPNPSKFYININSNQVKQIEIIDMFSKLIIHKNIANCRVDISALNSGIYCVKLITQNGSTTLSKLLVQ